MQLVSARTADEKALPLELRQRPRDAEAAGGAHLAKGDFLGAGHCGAYVSGG
jgi:hypothetical protein